VRAWSTTGIKIGLVLLAALIVPRAIVFVLRRAMRGGTDAAGNPSPVLSVLRRVLKLAAWIAGFVLYQWLSPQGPTWWTDAFANLHPGHATWTASLPSFAAAFVLATAAGLVFGREDARRAGRRSREPLPRPR
jgi:hypothetical protein